MCRFLLCSYFIPRGKNGQFSASMAKAKPRALLCSSWIFPRQCKFIFRVCWKGKNVPRDAVETWAWEWKFIPLDETSSKMTDSTAVIEGQLLWVETSPQYLLVQIYFINTIIYLYLKYYLSRFLLCSLFIPRGKKWAIFRVSGKSKTTSFAMQLPNFSRQYKFIFRVCWKGKKVPRDVVENWAKDWNFIPSDETISKLTDSTAVINGQHLWAETSPQYLLVQIYFINAIIYLSLKHSLSRFLLRSYFISRGKKWAIFRISDKSKTMCFTMQLPNFSRQYKFIFRVCWKGKKVPRDVVENWAKDWNFIPSDETTSKLTDSTAVINGQHLWAKTSPQYPLVQIYFINTIVYICLKHSLCRFLLRTYFISRGKNGQFSASMAKTSHILCYAAPQFFQTIQIHFQVLLKGEKGSLWRGLTLGKRLKIYWTRLVKKLLTRQLEQ